MNPRRQGGSRAAAKAHQEAQRALRGTATTLSLREATETFTLQQHAGGNGDGAGSNGTHGAASDVNDLTNRLMAKVEEAKNTRIDILMRRASTVAATSISATAGKRTTPGQSAQQQPFRLDIKVLQEEEEEELCVLMPDQGGPSPTAHGDSSTGLAGPAGSRQLSPEWSQSSGGNAPGTTAGAGEVSPVEDTAVDAERERQMVENIRKRHEMRRMRSVLDKEARSKSTSPTSLVASFPPPPLDAPLLPPGVTFGGPPLQRSSPLLAPLPTGLGVNSGTVTATSSLSLQRTKSADFTNRLSAVLKQGDAERIVKANSFQAATSKSAAVTFAAAAKTAPQP